MILQKGANTYIKHTNEVQIKLYWECDSSGVTPYCLLVDDDSSIHSVIDGREENSFVKVTMMGEQQIQYQINLNELPSASTKIIFSIVVKGSQPVREVGLLIENENSIQIELNNNYRDGAVVLGEIYSYKTSWKMRAVGEGVKGGKKELMQLYRFLDSDIEKEMLPNIVTVIDSSIYTRDFFESGKLQKLFKDLFIASSTIHPLGGMDVYFFAVLHKRSEKATRHNFQTYIENFYPKATYFYGLGVENDELSILNELLHKYKDSETIFYLITNGDVPLPDTFLERIHQAAENSFWEVIVLNDEGTFSGKTNLRNVSIVPFKTLKMLHSGELHQTILKPINFWRNNGDSPPLR